MNFSIANVAGFRVKLQNVWSSIKTTVRQYLKDATKANKELGEQMKALMFLLYTLFVFKVVFVIAVVFMEILHNASDKAESLLVLPDAFVSELVTTIQRILVGYGTIYQVGICVLAFAVLSVICRPAGLFLTFCWNTILSADMSFKEKTKAMGSEAIRLFDYYEAKVTQYINGIVKVAVGTFIVWLVWNLLQMNNL